jgi:hypothetical protein
MAFTQSLHGLIACWNLLFLPVFLIVTTFLPNPPTSVVLTTEILTQEHYSVETKMQMLRNETLLHNSNNKNNQTEPNPDPPKTPHMLHFTAHSIDSGPFLLLAGVGITAYSMMSAAWSKTDSGVGTVFDSTTVTSDMSMMLMDAVFWGLFGIFHIYQYLLPIGICTFENIALFVIVTLLTSWGLCSRVWTQYPTALVFVVGLLGWTHMNTFGAVVERETDLWVLHFFLVAADAILIFCHTIDPNLCVDVVFNCRISYVACLGVLMLAGTIFLAG